MSLENVSGKPHLLGGRGTFDIEGVVGLLLFPGFSTLWGQDSRSVNMWSMRDSEWAIEIGILSTKLCLVHKRLQLHPFLWSHARHGGGSISPYSFPAVSHLYVAVPR